MGMLARFRHSPCRRSAKVLGVGGALSAVLSGGVITGCSSSSNGGAGPVADASADSACSPEAVSPSDAGACNDCILAMCGSPLMQCNADCTCGMTVNAVNACIVSHPPSADAAAGTLGQLGALLPGGGAGLSCLLPYLGSGGMGVSTATSGLITCTLSSCGTHCFGSLIPEGGPALEDGSPEASASDAAVEGAGSSEPSPEPQPEPALEAGPDAD
jgi:hypothetical protein